MGEAWNTIVGATALQGPLLAVLVLRKNPAAATTKFLTWNIDMELTITSCLS